MEYLTEFPTLEERWDFWCFPPQYSDPHYHTSRLKKHDDGRSRKRPSDERPPTFGSSSDREPRCNALGRGGFMSPMRWIAEAVRRVLSVQDVNIVSTVENIPDTPVNDQWDDSIGVTPELNPPIDNSISSSINPLLHEREDTSEDPLIVAEHVPLLNGGPTTSQQAVVDSTPTTGTITSTPPAEPILAETVSIPPTPPDTSMGITERVPLTEPICLTTEDLQIRCTICNTIDCMIHNPRHRYCMDCGQRLLGPHVCSNRIDRTIVSISHNTVGSDERRPIRMDNNNPEVLSPRHYEPNMDVLENRISGNNPLIPREMLTRQMPPFSTSSEICHHDLPTYEEAITPGPEVPIRTRILLNEQEVLPCNDYSSDPDEAQIHFEILSPTRPSRSRHRNVNIRRE